MATPLPVLIDLNIILDVFGSREPFYEASSEVLAAAEVGLVEGYVAAHTVTTFFYIASKYRSPAVVHSQLIDLLQFLKVATVDMTVVKQALALPYRDFEDAVQMMAGVYAGAEYVVTRNLSDFKVGPLPALSPGELLTLIGERRGE
jgi:hypothetical protein